MYRAVRKDGKFVLGRNEILQWLLKQEDYAVHKEARAKFKRRRVIAPYVDYQWDMDTADMDNVKKQNEGYAYFLLVVDILSKIVWTVPFCTRKGREMVQALTSDPDFLRREKAYQYEKR